MVLFALVILLAVSILSRSLECIFLHVWKTSLLLVKLLQFAHKAVEPSLFFQDFIEWKTHVV
jgi:hypothetical protein